ncbi:hypothetical protein [uncultured Helcococcus sp.]|uniref:hypothetical protein n=1 Tax=uncultured Helcococcus sp. TaxID=1072508 RepID=UPI00260EB1E3|nr:hypothetical protein [uncultured Helcococcus sp.]
MKKKFVLTLLIGTLFLTACSSDNKEKVENSDVETTNKQKETNTAKEQTKNKSNQAQGTENENAVYKIGETLDMESFEWEVPYQITVKSVDITREYNGEDITEYVANARETNNFFVAKTIIKNTGDEAIIPGEYVNPKLGEDLAGNGEQFVFELSEEKLSKELAPGEEVELDFVFLKNLEHLEDPNGNFFLHFEGFTGNQKSYAVPTK